MSVKYQPVPPADTSDGSKRKVPEATHGGLRDNIHYNAYEAMCPDEYGMGRDALRRTEPYSDDEVLATDKVDTIKSATPVRGSGKNYTTSKWAQKNTVPSVSTKGE